MKTWKPALFAGALALGSMAAAAPAAALSVSELYFFGDSNVDIGRVASDPVPNDGLIPPPNTVGGRSSNGPIIPEYLAARVGVAQQNYSWGGATSGLTNIVGLFGNADLLPTGTLSQINEYQAALGGGSADSNALYVVWAGSNDLVFVDKAVQADVDAAVAGAAANLTAAVNQLAGLGAQNIVLTTRTPRPVLATQSGPTAEPNPAAYDDAAGRQLNDAIRGLVPVLDATSSANVLLFDDYALIADMVMDPATYGFLPYDSAATGYCINNADCTGLINYDAAHKTSAVHSILADQFIDQFELTARTEVVPLPAAGLLLLGGIAGLAVAGRGRSAKA